MLDTARPRATALAEGKTGEALSQVNVLTRSYDLGRTATNTAESELTQANVPGNMGLLFQAPVDDKVFAQVLYVSSLTIGGSVHNVLYVATMNNTIYAFDADNGASLLSRPELQQRQPGAAPVADGGRGLLVVHGRSVGGDIGIVGTPVIDLPSKTMYFVTLTNDFGGSPPVFNYRLRAVDITTLRRQAEQRGLHRRPFPLPARAALRRGLADAAGGARAHRTAPYRLRRLRLRGGDEPVARLGLRLRRGELCRDRRVRN